MSMIRSFADKDTQALWQRQSVKRFHAFERIALRKLVQIEASTKLDDLRFPPGNRLEVLKGSRRGQMSLRINDQWRICFRWHNGAAEDVKIVDYH